MNKLGLRLYFFVTCMDLQVRYFLLTMILIFGKKDFLQFNRWVFYKKKLLANVTEAHLRKE